MRTFIKGLLAATLLTSSAAHAAEPVKTVDVDPALWVVKDADTTIYLFGTVHVLKPGLGWFDDGVKAAFDASSELLTEMIEPDEQTTQKVILSKALDPDGPALSQKLSPDARKAYEAAMASVGLPVAAFEPFEPWMAAMMLAILPLQKLGYDPNSGVEKQLEAAAKSPAKTRTAFETLEEQIGFFDQLPEQQQIDFLNETVKEVGNAGATLDAMVKVWGEGKPDELAALMNRELGKYPEIAKVLLSDRNARWAKTIKARLDKPGTVFVAVGAGHLAGKDSVQDYLKAEGLEATRVAY
jgi:uncharacterized protein